MFPKTFMQSGEKSVVGQANPTPITSLMVLLLFTQKWALLGLFFHEESLGVV